jgi:hypothetical protein
MPEKTRVMGLFTKGKTMSRDPAPRPARQAADA